MSRTGLCMCDNVEFQTYGHVVGMKKPFKDGWESVNVPIDVCIATEIAELWHQGVITLSSCCGHKKHLANTVVKEGEEEKMLKLGYKPCPPIPSGLPCFYLKTGTNKSQLNKGELKK